MISSDLTQSLQLEGGIADASTRSSATQLDQMSKAKLLVAIRRGRWSRSMSMVIGPESGQLKKDWRTDSVRSTL
jgi:hypothetical protein